MKVFKDISLKDFHFWSGAAETAKLLTEDELDMIEETIFSDEEYHSETDINNFFWFEDDIIAKMLGYGGGEEMWEDRYKG